MITALTRVLLLMIATLIAGGEERTKWMVEMFREDEAKLLGGISSMAVSQNETRVLSYSLYGSKPKYLYGAVGAWVGSGMPPRSSALGAIDAPNRTPPLTARPPHPPDS